MTITHQKLALRGRKTRTLRAQTYEPGVYKMVNRSGHSLGSIAVAFVTDKPIYWPKLCAHHQAELAKLEGYDDVESFVRAARRIAGPKFFAGTKGLYLHSLHTLSSSAMSFDEVGNDEP